MAKTASNFRWCCRKTANGMIILGASEPVGRLAFGTVPLDTARYAGLLEGSGFPTPAQTVV
jgi:hypothetical protein